MDKDGLVPITFKSRKHRFFVLLPRITKKQYPLVNIQKAIENGPVERVDLPSYKMVIFHRFLYVYQVGYFGLGCQDLVWAVAACLTGFLGIRGDRQKLWFAAPEVSRKTAKSSPKTQIAQRKFSRNPAISELWNGSFSVFKFWNVPTWNVTVQKCRNYVIILLVLSEVLGRVPLLAGASSGS